MDFLPFSPAFTSPGYRPAGRVYEDLNGNGRMDHGEPGVPSVGVSIGRKVVLTDERGRYELQVDRDDILFVIKPAGYRVVPEKN